MPLPTVPRHTPLNYYKPSFFQSRVCKCLRASCGSDRGLSVFNGFVSCSGFAPIPVETGGSAPAATSSGEDLGSPAGCAVQTSTSRPKEDPAPTAPSSSAPPQKMNGEI
jgi:hypothetical protein